MDAVGNAPLRNDTNAGELIGNRDAVLGALY